LESGFSNAIASSSQKDWKVRCHKWKTLAVDVYFGCGKYYKCKNNQGPARHST